MNVKAIAYLYTWDELRNLALPLIPASPTPIDLCLLFQNTNGDEVESEDDGEVGGVNRGNAFMAAPFGRSCGIRRYRGGPGTFSQSKNGMHIPVKRLCCP